MSICVKLIHVFFLLHRSLLTSSSIASQPWKALPPKSSWVMRTPVSITKTATPFPSSVGANIMHHLEYLYKLPSLQSWGKTLLLTNLHLIFRITRCYSNISLSPSLEATVPSTVQRVSETLRRPHFQLQFANNAHERMKPQQGSFFVS